MVKTDSQRLWQKAYLHSCLEWVDGALSLIIWPCSAEWLLAPNSRGCKKLGEVAPYRCWTCAPRSCIALSHISGEALEAAQRSTTAKAQCDSYTYPVRRLAAIRDYFMAAQISGAHVDQ
ncbi:hypothetical protein D3C80_1783680 [compost metagenome]